MGRVSKHRKTKSCDPFYKGKKTDLPTKIKKIKKCAEGSGLEEQKMPRTMKDILERAKQMKGKKKKKLKRLDEGNKKVKKKKQALFQQQKGESKKKYFNRIDREAASAVVESMKKNKKMSERRKSHLKKRKEKEKVKKNPERALSTIKEFSDFKDEVKFGDVVLQPPMLTAKPRKAPLESKAKKSLLLSSKFLSKENQTLKSSDKPEGSDDKNSIPKSKKRKHMTEIEKAVLDKERMRVIEAYKAAKKKTLGEK
ncbi:coiled-coil domain-containing protein 137-like [Actinia tenebrosa]|uniref:Coiled-coil domain-containing protein 137-like n=1 Tax=Actinia tenebrosa TaxID=6105 RepID=A0A6P8IDB4_ACTTE|nr:coiled-coil domain-containing protein 137-like [Actinia tenebrosa]